MPGIYISDAEVDAIFRQSNRHERVSPLPLGWSSNRLSSLSEKCSLAPFDQAALLLAAAPAIEQRYSRVYAYLQDDLTRPFATPGLAIELFGGGFGERARLRARFAADAPLRALELVRLSGDDTEPLLGRRLTVDEALVTHLLNTEADSTLGEPARRLVLDPDCADAVRRVAGRWRQAEGRSRPVLFVAGEPGSGRRLLARHLADALCRRLSVVVASDAAPSHVRDAALAGSVLCLAEADGLFDPKPTTNGTVTLALPHTEVSLVVTLANPELAPPSFAGRQTILLRLPAAGNEERAAIWRQEAAAAGIELDEEFAHILAATYRLGGGAIAAAVSRAAVDDGSATPSLQRLYSAARRQSSMSLGRLGQEVAPRFGREDIVLPVDVADVLSEIVQRVRNRPKVFGEWGFGARHSRSRSLSALFAGPSGTGKTMAAEVIANELRLPMYRVDLASVVSKYIGETEKNLAQVFNEAAAASAVLFFDEADALFGKRSEVRDSHDRYANIEVSYLLQRMEDYDGIVILASNLRQNLDEAFVRRLHLTADFPFPDTAARYEIWRRTLPSAVPLAPDVDLALLSKRYRLSGGNIRNACVTAAFLAAADGSEVRMFHLLMAVRREHQKMGKLLLDEDAAR